ncbi:MAG: type II toxin-antitoxin system RelE/ParE family toxin [Flavobacteriaceae bacterium]|nr:MAG: type II toxin-antitoxin system RelE/ParE family toxin [Flavobacteriaceae bacterium]
MSEFKWKIKIYKNHFWDFYNEQNKKVQGKIDWIVTLVQTTKVVPGKFLKHLTNTDGLWEIRVSANNKIFRIFCFFDKGNLVVLLSGFQKKTQKTPKSELKRAERLKKEYYENKK